MLQVLLPPIIFSAGLAVQKKSFFRNFVSIASLGILGTYVGLTFIVLSLLLYRKCFGFLTMQVTLHKPPAASSTVSLLDSCTVTGTGYIIAVQSNDADIAQGLQHVKA